MNLSIDSQLFESLLVSIDLPVCDCGFMFTLAQVVQPYNPPNSCGRASFALPCIIAPICLYFLILLESGLILFHFTFINLINLCYTLIVISLCMLHFNCDFSKHTKIKFTNLPYVIKKVTNKRGSVGGGHILFTYTEDLSLGASDLAKGSAEHFHTWTSRPVHFSYS